MGNAEKTFGWNFDNSYSRLPDVFFERILPAPTENPQIAFFNSDLAAQLGLDGAALNGPKGARFFSGNAIPVGAEPLAQAYAGHQFGHFNTLGDGRANLLGEQITPAGARFDIHLKGSGPTKYSRRGDGRAALGPMLREYIVSEAMFALGIPTTRSLAVVTTGESVYRQELLPGGILTRVAQSHLRVGTFEFAAALSTPDPLRALANYAIHRHYSDFLNQPEPYLAFLRAMIERQAKLIARWMHVGFIHGVMNTDNMTISGETIDYGPCAFMDHFAGATVFSSIDHQGRYAYENQPAMGEWNVTRFAETLLPLLDSDPEKAAEKAVAAVDTFSELFQKHWLGGMRDKLGLESPSPEDLGLIGFLLRWMEEKKADYTMTFRSLSTDQGPTGGIYDDPQFQEWRARWLKRNPSLTNMRKVNPSVIPRNHQVEEAIAAAVTVGDFSVMTKLLAALRHPFTEDSASEGYRTPPDLADENYRTFCGT